VEEREEIQQEVSACITSVMSKPAFNYDDLVPMKHLSSVEDKCNMRYDEIRRINQSKEVGYMEVHDL